MGRRSANGLGIGTHGDLTTTGAVCISSLPNASFEQTGVLRLGDVTTPCPKCSRPGKIVESYPAMDWEGIPTALDGAIIRCGCPPGTNRLIAPCERAPETRTFSGSPIQPNGSASTNTQPSQSAQSSQLETPSPVAQTAARPQPVYGRTFSIIDSETRRPFSNRVFIETVEGRQKVGMTDTYGVAHVMAPAEGSAISIHVPFQSPARVLNELTIQPMVGNNFKTQTQAQERRLGEPVVPTAITINDRAASREALIRQIRLLGHEFFERSEWKANAPASPLEADWDYSMIALHHAGRSYKCGPGEEQMLETQLLHQQPGKYQDIAYHFGVDCSGAIYEGRDIRFKASSVSKYNTGVIGIVLLNNSTTPEEGEDYKSWGRIALNSLGLYTSYPIPTAQIEATVNLITALKSIFVIRRFGGHKEFPGQKGDGKICPGKIGMKLVKNIRTQTKLLPPPAPWENC